MKKKCFIRFLSLFLIVGLCLPTMALAATPEVSEPLASEQLSHYASGIAALGSGDLAIEFFVFGVGLMDSIGAQRIRLYESLDGENWYCVANYAPANHPNMMAYEARAMSSSVSYSGVAGRYYKAFVTVTASNSSGLDIRSFWTTVVRAT